MDIGAIITSISGILGTSSIIGTLILKRIDKLEKMLDKRENDRVQENIARGEALQALGVLTEANTTAIRTVTSEEACAFELSGYRKAAKELEHFMREKAAEYLHAT